MGATTAAGLHGETFELTGWKSILGHVAAVIVGVIFLATGLAKIVFPFLVQQLFEQLLVPTWASMPLVIALGIAETLGGALVLIPRYRRWGALLISLSTFCSSALVKRLSALSASSRCCASSWRPRWLRQRT